MMKIDTQVRHVAKPGANLFAELGFSPDKTRREQIDRTFALGNLILAITAYLAFLPCASAHPQIADPVPATHPCAFIGVWAEIKNQMAYKVTLSENGGFVAEPTASGASGAAYIGLWEVRGDKLEWKTNGSQHPDDINQIKNLSAKSFSLVEVNGSLTAFDLIEATKTANCPRLN
jgi:hypothetical protein